MRRHYDGLRHCHCRNVHQRSYTTHGANIGVEDVRGAAGEALEEGLLRVQGLAGDDRDANLLTDFGQQLDIVGKARLLIPLDPELGEAAADADRMRRRETAMRLD